MTRNGNLSKHSSTLSASERAELRKAKAQGDLPDTPPLPVEDPPPPVDDPPPPVDALKKTKRIKIL